MLRSKVRFALLASLSLAIILFYIFVLRPAAHRVDASPIHSQDATRANRSYFFVTTSGFTLTDWVHMPLTARGQAARIFADGVQVNRGADASANTRIQPPTTPSPVPAKTSAGLPCGLCPLRIGGEIRLDNLFSNTHRGLDIAAPPGTPHYSPDDCGVLYFFIDSNGSHSIAWDCPNLELTQVQLAHLDFSFDDDDTLEYYGISRNLIYNPDGSFRTGTEPIYPTRNGFAQRGKDLHLYVGTTGTQFHHTHINALYYDPGTTQWSFLDPLNFLDCRSHIYLPLAMLHS